MNKINGGTKNILLQDGKSVAREAMLTQRIGHKYEKNSLTKNSLTKNSLTKNSLTMYQELEERQGQAIQRAERLMTEYRAGHNPQQDNPCTSVHLLVRELRKNVPL